MGGPIKCDNDGEQAAYTVGVVATGEQKFLCPDCFGGEHGGVTPIPPPDTCEICESEPVAVRETMMPMGPTLHLGQRCYLVHGRAAWLMADPSDYQDLDGMAHQISEAKPERGGSKRRGPGRVAVDETKDPGVTLVSEKELDQVVKDTPTPEPQTADAGSEG